MRSLGLSWMGACCQGQRPRCPLGTPALAKQTEGRPGSQAWRWLQEMNDPESLLERSTTPNTAPEHAPEYPVLRLYHTPSASPKCTPLDPEVQAVAQASTSPHAHALQGLHSDFVRLPHVEISYRSLFHNSPTHQVGPPPTPVLGVHRLPHNPGSGRHQVRLRYGSNRGDARVSACVHESVCATLTPASRTLPRH